MITAAQAPELPNLKSKTVLFLGAAAFQTPPIFYAREKGYRVVTCDNRPENPGHAFADKSYCVSTRDKVGVLRVAKKEKINAILTYASDVSMPVAVWVARKLCLPGPTIQAVQILTDKSLFREFLMKRKLQTNFLFEKFTLAERQKALRYLKSVALPRLVKPVDSGGSKGVALVRRKKDISSALREAYRESFSEKIIVEEFIQKKGMQICGDAYMERGVLKFAEFGDGYFYDDGRFLAPWGESFPSSQPKAFLTILKKKIQTICRDAGFLNGVVNVDALVNAKGEIFILEIGPRSGGNFLQDAIFLRTGVRLVEAVVESALHRSYRFHCQPRFSRKFFACYMLHSRKAGVLRSVDFNACLQKNILRYIAYLEPGSPVKPFTKGSHAVGHLLLSFDSADTMRKTMLKMPHLCRVLLK